MKFKIGPKMHVLAPFGVGEPTRNSIVRKKFIFLAHTDLIIVVPRYVWSKTLKKCPILHALHGIFTKMTFPLKGQNNLAFFKCHHSDALDIDQKYWT